MNRKIYTIDEMKALVKPLAEKYKVREIYLFGSYARGEADEESDLDFLVYCDERFPLTLVFALGEEMREAFQKDVDAFEIHEVNIGSDFHKSIMKDRLLIYNNSIQPDIRKSGSFPHK